MRRAISRWSALSNFPAPALASRAAISGSNAAMASGTGELAFEVGDPCFQSFNALSELAHVIRAVPRCSGSGRGPSRACMRSSLGHLHGLGDLRVRGREQPGDLVGQRLVGREPGKLALPKVEITP